MKQVMHLFPRKTNKTGCGVWGIMTPNLEDVTCEACLKTYNHQDDEAKTKPNEVNDGVEDNADGTNVVEFSRVTSPDYSIGLARNF